MFFDKKRCVNFRNFKKIKVLKVGSWGKERAGAFLAPQSFLRYNKFYTVNIFRKNF